MNVWGDECLNLGRGWWTSEVMNVWGDECLRWWTSEVMNVRGDECLILGRGCWMSEVMNVGVMNVGQSGDAIASKKNCSGNFHAICFTISLIFVGFRIRCSWCNWWKYHMGFQVLASAMNNHQPSSAYFDSPHNSENHHSQCVNNDDNSRSPPGPDY